MSDGMDVCSGEYCYATGPSHDFNYIYLPDKYEALISNDLKFICDRRWCTKCMTEIVNILELNEVKFIKNNCTFNTYIRLLLNNRENDLKKRNVDGGKD